MSARRPWRRCAACGGVCHWYDDLWLCEDCDSGWMPDHDLCYLPPDIKRLPTGYVLAWATNAAGEHPTPTCSHVTDDPVGPSADCIKVAVWGRVDQSGLRGYDEYACGGHVKWLAAGDPGDNYSHGMHSIDHGGID